MPALMFPLFFMLQTMPTATAARDGATDPKAIDASSWFTSDDYPPAALRAAEEGRVVYRVSVDANGRATKCDIMTSSGSPVLDVKTCDIVEMRGRFEPARDAAGVAVTGVTQGSMRWTMGVPPPVDVSVISPLDSMTIDILVGSDGLVSQCTVVAATGTPASPQSLSPCAKYPAGSRYFGPTRRDGKPVSTRIRITSSETRSFD